MKYIGVLITCIFFLGCSGYKDAVPEGFYKFHDTLFIKREVCDTCVTYPYYHAIYLEQDPTGKNHKNLQNFSFSEFENFDSYIKLLKENGIKFIHLNTMNLPSEWLSLNLYKGKYYLYAPSDWGYLSRRIITDSSVMHWNMEGPIPFNLVSFNNVGLNIYHIECFDPYKNCSDCFTPESLNIYIIDTAKKIAIWEYKSKNSGKYQYELLIAKESVPIFDVIDNFCVTDKQGELEFDTPNYDSLLRKFRRQ